MAPIGCPRSGSVNANRLQCKYKYKLTVRDAEIEASNSLNDVLYHKLIKKDDRAFWKEWRKKFCSSSLKPTTVLNGNSGDANICDTFSEHFQSVFKPNTPDWDKQYGKQVSDRLRQSVHDTDIPSVTTEHIHQCVSNMKCNKSPGHDGIMAEHLKYGGPELYVHLSLLFNAMLKHSFVPDKFAHGIIIPLLKDKHDDSSKLDMYRGITLSPSVSKLFEHVLLQLCEEQLFSD